MNETEEEQEPVSYPDFSITIEKENKDNVLEFECKSFKKMKTTIFSNISIFGIKIFYAFSLMMIPMLAFMYEQLL